MNPHLEGIVQRTGLLTVMLNGRGWRICLATDVEGAVLWLGWNDEQDPAIDEPWYLAAAVLKDGQHVLDVVGKVPGLPTEAEWADYQEEVN